MTARSKANPGVIVRVPCQIEEKPKKYLSILPWINQYGFYSPCKMEDRRTDNPCFVVPVRCKIEEKPSSVLKSLYTVRSRGKPVHVL